MKKKFSLSSKFFFMMSVSIVFLVMLVLNFLTPLIADDLEYLYKTQDFSTILQNEYTQYMTWTGRSIVHIIARIFLLMPKFIFNIFNSLAFAYLTLLIFYISRWTHNKKYSIGKYLLISVALWLFIPTFGQVFLWETGSANYLWGSIIMLSMIAIYHKAYLTQSNSFLERYRVVGIILMLLFGVVSGWCNENTSGGALLIVIMYVLVMKFKNNHFKPWMISGIVGMTIGLILMVSAPGNAIRSTYFERATWSFSKKLILGIIQITENLKDHAILFFILLGIFIILGFLVHKNSIRSFIGLGYVIAGLATIYVLSLSPSGLNWGRSFYGGVLYFIIALFMNYPDNLNIEKSGIKYAYVVLSAILIIPFVFSFILGIADIGKSYISINKRYEYLEKQKESGNLNPLFADIDSSNNTNYPAYSNILSHVGLDTDSQINRSTARYFGLKSVKAISIADWNNIYLNGDPSLMKISNLTEYLKVMAEKDYVVALVAINYSESINSEDFAQVQKLFPNFQISNNMEMTYCGVLNSKNDKGITKNNFSSLRTTINKKLIKLESSYTHYENQRFAYVKIDDLQLSRNMDGLNFVVFDKNSGKVLDSVNFNQSENPKGAFR